VKTWRNAIEIRGLLLSGGLETPDVMGMDLLSARRTEDRVEER